MSLLLLFMGEAFKVLGTFHQKKIMRTTQCMYSVRGKYFRVRGLGLRYSN
jgi:hypothetical protein